MADTTDKQHTYGEGSVLCAVNTGVALSDAELQQHVNTLLEGLGPRHKVLVVPPDYTRAHSQVLLPPVSCSVGRRRGRSPG